MVQKGANRKSVGGQLGHYEMPVQVQVMKDDGKTPLDNVFRKQYKSGAVFEGHLENGVKCGHGKMQLPTGVSYEGEWKDNMQCGEGEMKWPDGGVYTGDFLNDLRHGKGTQKFPNGEVYEGDFYKDKRHGKGVYTWPDGTKFTGRFYCNEKEGYGKFQFPDKSTFTGLYKENERCGPGVFTYADGTQDCGLWKKELLLKICSSIRDAFSIIDFPEFEFDPKEHEMMLSSGDANPLNLVENSMNQFSEYSQSQLPAPPYCSTASTDVKEVRFDDQILENIVYDLYSNRLPSVDSRQLVYDQSEFDSAFYAEALSANNNEVQIKSAVAFNKTPALIVMQRHVLRNHYWENDQHFNVKNMMVGNRSEIADRGPIEKASEMFLNGALQGDNEVVTRILRLRACYVDVMDRNGNTAVHLAAINGHHDVLNTLLNFGADINRVTNEGVSALSACHVLFYDVADFKPNGAEMHLKEISAKTNPGGVESGQTEDGDPVVSNVDCPSAVEAKLEGRRINARQIRLKKRALTNKRYCTPDEYEATDLAYKPVKSAITATGAGGDATKDANTSSNESSSSEGGKEKEEKKTKGNEKSRDEVDGQRAAATEKENRVEVVEPGTETDAVAELSPEDVLEAGDEEGSDRAQKETASEMKSTQSLYNFHIEVTPQMIEKTATNLSENERLRITLLKNDKPDPGTVREIALKKIKRNALIEMIKLLLRRGANPNSSLVPFPVLFFALKTADPAGVENLLSKGASTETRLPKEKGGLAPLHIAVTLPGDAGVQITKLLLEAGANPNTQAYPYDSLLDPIPNVEDVHDENQRTALEILSLDHPVTVPMCGGNTPLSYACERDDDYPRARQIMRLLLAHDANCNVLNPRGLSPLAQLIISGNDLGIDELLAHNADPSLALTHGSGSALCVASSTEFEHRRSPEARIQLIDKLMSAGANLLTPIVIGTPGKPSSVGTAVDFAFHKYYLDKRVAYLPYHALSPLEREIFNARKDLLAHLGDLLRKTVVRKEFERLLKEEEDGNRSVSPSNKFFHSGYGANTPLGIVKPNRGTSADVIRIMSIKENVVTVDASKKMMTKDEVKKILKDGKLRIRKPLFKYCYECGRSTGVKLAACTRCKEVFYCGKPCKLKAWNARHKEECVRLANKERNEKDRTRDMDRMDSPTPTTDAKKEEAGQLTDILIPKPKRKVELTEQQIQEALDGVMGAFGGGPSRHKGVFGRGTSKKQQLQTIRSIGSNSKSVPGGIIPNDPYENTSVPLAVGGATGASMVTKEMIATAAAGVLQKPNKVIAVSDETKDSRKLVKLYPRKETYDKKGNRTQSAMRNEMGEKLTENYSFV